MISLPPNSTWTSEQVATLLATLDFAARKHAFQKRKDREGTPYIVRLFFFLRYFICFFRSVGVAVRRLVNGRCTESPRYLDEVVATGKLVCFCFDTNNKPKNINLFHIPQNHPIGVANYLTKSGIYNLAVIQAAILHDTIEDTGTTAEEIEVRFIYAFVLFLV